MDDPCALCTALVGQKGTAVDAVYSECLLVASSVWIPAWKPLALAGLMIPFKSDIHSLHMR